MKTSIENSIAVVGISCCYPGAKNPKKLWENILAKRQNFRKFPDTRMPSSFYYSKDPQDEDCTSLARAAFIDGWEFDLAKWRIPQQTYESTDPTHWLTLELANEALQNLCLEKETLRKKTAVYIGNTLTGEFTRARSLRLRWPFMERVIHEMLDKHSLSMEEQKTLLTDIKQKFKSFFPKTNEDTLAGSLSNTIAGRICNYFKFGGGGYTVDGACSSSLLAIITAVERLASGEIDMAVAGGVDISLDPFEVVGFSKAGALAKSELAIYDQKASGMIPGEGAGVVVMKRMQDAIEDGNYIYAVVKGWGISSDGEGAITAPKVDGQSRALEAAWKRANYKATDINFIEGHGTGTVLGDKVELEAMNRAINLIGSVQERRCGVTSLKSIIGHTKAAAGIGAFLKAVIAVNQRVLPPTAGCAHPHSIFQEKAKSIYPIINSKVYDNNTILKAGVSAMGFGGINAHVALESGSEALLELRPQLSTELLNAHAQDAEVFVLTASSKQELMRKCQELLIEIENIAYCELADLSSHLFAKVPKNDSERLAIVAATPDNLTETLQETIAFFEGKSSRPTNVFWSETKKIPTIGFVFPGQGSQCIDMAVKFLLRDKDSSHFIQIIKDTLGEKDFAVFYRSLYPCDATKIDEKKELNKILSQTKFAQPAICLASLLYVRWLKELGVEANIVCGHSLGELSALYASGAYDATSLLKLALQRGQSMTTTTSDDGMLSLATTSEIARDILHKANCQQDDPEKQNYAVIANKNHQKQTIVAGFKKALQNIVKIAQQLKIEYHLLPVSRAFHSKLMDNSVNAFAALCDIPNIETQLTIDFVSAVNGETYKNIYIKKYLEKQITANVDFKSAIENVMNKVDILIEVGTGRILSNIISVINDKKQCFPMEGKPNSDKNMCELVASLFSAGVPINYKVLFEKRLIHPYVKPKDRKFLVNPCEAHVASNYKPISIVKQQEQIETVTSNLDPLSSLRAHISSITGFPVETIEPQHRLLDNLNLDSIKAAEVISVFSREYSLNDGFNPTTFTNASLEEIVAQVSSIKKTKISNQDVFVHSFAREWILQKDLCEVEQCSELFSIVGENPALLEAIKQKLSIAENAPNYIVVLPQQESKKTILWLQQLTSKSLASITIIDPNYLENDIKRIHGVESFISSIQLENPTTKVRFISVSPLLSYKIVVSKIISEFYGQENFRSVHFDTQGQRYIPQVKLIFPDTNNKLRAPQNVVLVTGGAKGITAECTLELAKHCQAKFVLVGTSKKEVVEDVLERFYKINAHVHYFQCDITNAQATEKLIATVRNNIGEVEWLIHGAGVNIPRRASLVSKDEIKWEIAPKLLGMENLLNIIPNQIQQIIAFTSIIGITGMPGNAWYAFANESLRRMLTKWHRENSHCQVCSLAFSIWDEVGMGAKLGSIDHLRNQGIEAIPVLEGVNSFMNWVFAAKKPHEIIITSKLGNILHDRWRPSVSKYQGRFVSTILQEEPEVFIEAESILSIEEDAYLKDHNFEGKMLFPTVFGLEAMAQGVQRLFHHKINSITFQQVNLAYPIVVENRLTLRLKVVRTGFRTFTCAIYCENTHYDLIHFSATVIINAFSSPNFLKITQEPLISNTKNLYKSLLFQGNLFQRINTVFSVSKEECSALIKTGLKENTSFWYQRQDVFVLGDLYQRDALLQMGQLMITPRIGLPIFMESIEINLNRQVGNLYAQTLLRTEKNKDIIGDVVAADKNGNIHEVLRGYCIRTLHSDPNLPLPENIVKYAEEQKLPNAKTTETDSPKAHNKIFALEDHERGTRGEVVFLYRFPLRFSSMGNPSGGIHFATYLHWVGETREIGIRKDGIYELATNYISTQNYAWITKETNIRIVGSAKSNDFIEVECWNERLYGIEDASLEMIYHFYACRDDKRYPLAEVAQTTTWAKVIDHGVVKPISYPKDMLTWIKATLPQNNERKQLSWQTNLEKGEKVWCAPEGPEPGILLYEHSYRTTPRHANFVGNIYWSNYADWMGEVRDLWLQDFIEYGKGEMRCISSYMQHLREAMPGDTVVVKMHLQKQYQKGLDFQFNFYKLVDSHLEKLATSSHNVHWFERQNNEWKLSQFPFTIVENVSV